MDRKEQETYYVVSKMTGEELGKVLWDLFGGDIRDLLEDGGYVEDNLADHYDRQDIAAITPETWAVAWGSYDRRKGGSQMGRKGGKSKSDAKATAARENGRRGGRPRFIRTLRELIDEHDANGVVMIDAGNGSAGPRWISLEHIDEDMLSLSMSRHMSAPANRDARSATGDDKYIVRWASDWIEDDDRGGDFETQNPWRYKLLF
jgi:hypothetical protein